MVVAKIAHIHIRRWGLLLGLLTVLSGVVFGQNYFNNPVTLNVENGLSNDSIHIITKDSRGFIWIGTDGGLCRFDGSLIETFQNHPRYGDFFVNNRIFHLAEDRLSGDLWVGTVRGLGIIPARSGAFRVRSANLEAPDSLSDNIVRFIYQDRDDVFWLSCWTQGIVRYDRAADRFERHYFELPDSCYRRKGVDPSRINSVVAITQDARNEDLLWVATIAGLLRFNKRTGDLRLFYQELSDEDRSYLGNSFTNLYLHRDGRLFLGSFSVASVFDPITENFTLIGDDPAVHPTFPFERVLAIVPKNSAELWVTYEDGVALYHTGNQRITYTRRNDYEAGHHYGAWMVDEGGRLWNGTRKDGVFLYDPLRQQVRRFSLPIDRKNKDYIPQRILESPDGARLYFCVEDSDGLYILDRRTGQWRVVPPPPGYFDNHDAFQAVDLAWSAAGELLVLERDRLFRLSADERRLEPIPLPMGPGPYVFRRVLQHRSGDLWLTSRRNGVFRIRAGDGAVTHFRNELNDSVSTNQYIWVEHIFEDSRGWVWIRLARSYCVFQPERERLLKFPYQAGQRTNTFRYLRNFAEDRLGRVWLASEDEGLGLTDPARPEAGVIRRLTDAHGLPSNRLRYLEADAGGNIWVATANGLARLDPEHLRFQHYGRRYGIPDNGMTLDLLESSGEIAMGYTGGLALFHPDSLRPIEEKPRPYLTSFKVFDKELADAGRLFDGDPIELSYRQNFFSFEFSRIGYSIDPANHFAYRLQGFEEDWNYGGGRRYAAYTNVPGGDYVFQVRAATREKEWNETTYSLPIHISTPWWKTWAFSLGMLALLLLAAYTIYRYRIARIRREERMRSEFEKKLTNVEMSALRAQMNPHFIFNCLNSIDYYILKNETEKASDYLNRFSRLIRLILQNSSANYVNLKDELEALKLYMEMESLRFDHKFSYEVSVDASLQPEQVEIPPMLFQPYLENAIWHGLMHKEGHGMVRIALSRRNGYLKCVIEDDGIGREQAQRLKSKNSVRKKSMGMRITSDRIELINRLYDTHTSVRVIDLKDEAGKAAGTRVELDIPL